MATASVPSSSGPRISLWRFEVNENNPYKISDRAVQAILKIYEKFGARVEQLDDDRRLLIVAFNRLAKKTLVRDLFNKHPRLRNTLDIKGVFNEELAAAEQQQLQQQQVFKTPDQPIPSTSKNVGPIYQQDACWNDGVGEDLFEWDDDDFKPLSQQRGMYIQNKT